MTEAGVILLFRAAVRQPICYPPKEKSANSADACSGGSPLPDIRSRETWLKQEREDRIDASVVALAEGWPEDVKRLSNKLSLPKTAVPVHFRLIVYKG